MYRIDNFQGYSHPHVRRWQFERYVRQLRANIFGECSDYNWEACKDAWIENDFRWLTEHPKNNHML